MKVVFKSFLLVFVISCMYLTCTPEEDITGINSNDPVLKTGTLYLNLPMTALKTIVPDISMEPESYDIYGAGPDGADFSITSDQPSVEVPGLAFGEWTVTADAKNIDGTIIGQGEATLTVHVGETTQVTITVTPLDGYGAIDITLNWNAGDTEYPSIESQLVPATGSPVDLDFTITGGNQGTYVNSTIPTGYHTLVVKLLDGNPANTTPILTMGAVEIVRIIKDETSSGTFDFTQINQGTGTVQMSISAELDDTIDVTLSGQLDQIAEGGLMTVAASVPAEAGNVTYVWYINGESQDTGESYTVSGLPVGVYRLDVTAISTDGKRAGSENCEFRVNTEPTVQYGGKTYHIVQIGDQTWLKENLDVGSMINSTNSQTDNQIIEKFCYDDDPANCQIYGGLYQWNEAMDYTTDERAQGICPAGWHIPTYNDFQILSGFVGSDGFALLSIGQGGGSNISGFSGLLAGSWYYTEGKYAYINQYAYIWTSTVFTTVLAYNFSIAGHVPGVGTSPNQKDYGFTVRCLKD